MAKNKEVMSLAIKPQLKGEMIKFAKRKGLSNSAYIGNLIEQAVKLNLDDEPMIVGKTDEVTPVVLRIPNAYKADPERLKQWIDIQAAGIVKAITQQTSA